MEERGAVRDAVSPAGAVGPLGLGSPAFRQLFRTSANAMLIADDTRRYVAANAAAGRLFGLAPEQIVGRRIDDFTPPEAQPVLPVLWAQFREAGTQAGRFELQVGQRRIEIEFAATADIAPGHHLSILLTPSDRDGASEAPEPDSSPRPLMLSERERQVLVMLARGKTADETARELAISRNTVQNHLHNARQKLGARTRSHAIALAIGHGEIPLAAE